MLVVKVGVICWFMVAMAGAALYSTGTSSMCCDGVVYTDDGEVVGLSGGRCRIEASDGSWGGRVLLLLGAADLGCEGLPDWRNGLQWLPPFWT